MREHDRIGELAGELRGVIAGRYRLGVIPTMAPYILPRLVPSFSAAHPAVELDIEELTTDQIVERLAGNVSTGAFLRRLFTTSGCASSSLSRGVSSFSFSTAVDPYRFEGPRPSGSTPDGEAVDHAGRSLFARPDSRSLLAEPGGRSVPTFHPCAGSLTTLCKMVVEGPFFTILPALAAADLKRQGQGHLVKETAGRVPFREVSLVVHRTQRVAPCARRSWPNHVAGSPRLRTETTAPGQPG